MLTQKERAGKSRTLPAAAQQGFQGGAAALQQRAERSLALQQVLAPQAQLRAAVRHHRQPLALLCSIDTPFYAFQSQSLGLDGPC